MDYSNFIKHKKLKKIQNYNLGGVFKFINKNDKEFLKFGEVYFSFVKTNKIKCWKKHSKMTMNLVVPKGDVKFVFKLDYFDKFYSIILGNKNYRLLTVKPGIWFGFKGLSSENIVVNLSNIVHSQSEATILKKNKINYADW